MEHSKTKTIRVMEKEYQVNCPAGHEDELSEAAYLVDRKMREIRQGGRVVGLERIAIMAALNVAHELVIERSGRNKDHSLGISGFEERLQSLHTKIDGALTGASRHLSHSETDAPEEVMD